MPSALGAAALLLACSSTVDAAPGSAAAVPKWACALGDASRRGGPHLVANSRSNVSKFHRVVDQGEGKVLGVTRKTFSEELETADAKGVLVVFYAAWCGHCKEFVLRGEKAPLELLNDDLIKSGGPKVLKFDIDAGEVPQGFEVEVVPTVYFATWLGMRAKYEGDPNDRDLLKAFAAKGMENGHGPVQKVLKKIFGLPNVSAEIPDSVPKDLQVDVTASVVGQAPQYSYKVTKELPDKVTKAVKTASLLQIGSGRHNQSWAAIMASPWAPPSKSASAPAPRRVSKMSALQVGKGPSAQWSALQVGEGASESASNLVKLSYELNEHLDDKRLVAADPLLRLSESAEGARGAVLAQWVGVAKPVEQARPLPVPVYLSDLN